MKKIKNCTKMHFSRQEQISCNCFLQSTTRNFSWEIFFIKQIWSCPNTFKLVAIPKVGQQRDIKKYFSTDKSFSPDYPGGIKVLEQCSSCLVERMSTILYQLFEKVWIQFLTFFHEKGNHFFTSLWSDWAASNQPCTRLSV